MADPLLKIIPLATSKQEQLPPELEKTIAVLPFENMSDDKEHSWFGDAMTDEIIMQLCKVNEFIVRSRNSSKYAAPAPNVKPTNPANMMSKNLFVPTEVVGRFAGSTIDKIFKAPSWEFARKLA